VKIRANGTSPLGNLCYTVLLKIVLGMFWFYVIKTWFNMIIALDKFNSKSIT